MTRVALRVLRVPMPLRSMAVTGVESGKYVKICTMGARWSKRIRVTAKKGDENQGHERGPKIVPASLAVGMIAPIATRHR